MHTIASLLIHIAPALVYTLKVTLCLQGGRFAPTLPEVRLTNLLTLTRVRNYCKTPWCLIWNQTLFNESQRKEECFWLLLLFLFCWVYSFLYTRRRRQPIQSSLSEIKRTSLQRRGNQGVHASNTLRQAQQQALSQIWGSHWGWGTRLGKFNPINAEILHWPPSICLAMLYSQLSISKYPCPAHHQQCWQAFLHFEEDWRDPLPMTLGNGSSFVMPFPRLCRPTLPVTRTADMPLTFVLLAPPISGSMQSINASGYNTINWTIF